jgi:hypothetical protein
MRAKLKEIKEEIRRRRHQPIREQGKWLRQVVAGFFEYHAVPTNSRALIRFRHHVTDLWRRSLQRRSQKARITGNRIKKLADDFVPQPASFILGRMRAFMAESGDMIIIRYADDIIVGFQYETDARRFRGAMRERLGEYALSLHPDKTRLVEFGRLQRSNALGAALPNRKPSNSWASRSSPDDLAAAASR